MEEKKRNSKQKEKEGNVGNYSNNGNNGGIKPNRDRLSEVEFMFQNTNEWIKTADSKIGIISSIMFAVYAIIGAYMVSYIKGIKDYAENAGLKIFSIVLFGLSLLAFVVTLVFIVIAITPRCFGSKYSPEKRNSYFYADVNLYKKAKEFIDEAKKESYEDRVNSILEEVFINSRLCTKKMRWLTAITWILSLAIAFNILAVIVSLIAR